jgi:hypothetical protein
MADNDKDRAARRARYLRDYSIEVPETGTPKAQDEAADWPHAPYGYHMGRIKAYEDRQEDQTPPQRRFELARLAKYLREPERPSGNDHSRGRERTRECE